MAPEDVVCAQILWGLKKDLNKLRRKSKAGCNSDNPESQRLAV